MQPYVWCQLLLNLLVFPMGAVLSAAAVVPSSSVRSLTEVSVVRVVVEDLSEAMQQTGLRKEQLAALAVETLQKNGISVATAQDPRRVPIVYIRLSSVFADSPDHGPMSFYLTLQIKQPAVLAQTDMTRTTQSSTAAAERPLLVTTWENGTMAMINPSELFFYIKHTLINLLSDLAHDRQLASEAQASH